MALLNIITNLSVLLFDHNMWVKLIKHITIAFIAHIHIRPTGSSTSSMANPKVLLTQPARCISLLCLDPVAHRDPLPPLSLPFPIAGCFPNHNSQSLASQHPPHPFLTLSRNHFIAGVHLSPPTRPVVDLQPKWIDYACH